MIPLLEVMWVIVQASAMILVLALILRAVGDVIRTLRDNRRG